MAAHEPHPYSQIFPLDEGPPLWALAKDIEQNGQKHKITLYQGKILDGRRRELGCFRAKVEPKYQQFKGSDEQALEFVMSQNLHRRHLGEGDRVLAAAAYAKAKAGQPKKESSQNETILLPSDSQGIPTNSQSAEIFGTSESNVDRAKTVLANGTPELQDAVKDEIITVSDAAKVAKEDPEVQNAAVEKVRAGEAKTAAAAVAEIKATAAAKPEPIKDAVGTEVPEKALPAFEAAKEIGTLCRDIDKIVARVEEHGRGPGGRTLHTVSQVQTLKNVRQSLWGSRATHVCPNCKGDKPKCDACKDSGWTIKALYQQAAKAAE